MNKTYSVIYGDPPWTFRTYSHKGKGRSAEAHYDCMSTDATKKLDVLSLAAPDCLLAFWVPSPHLPQGIAVLEAWGFTYKTIGFIWVKSCKNAIGVALDPIKSFAFGNGYYTRATPELCLFCVRGKPKRLRRNVRQLIVAPRRKHSQKSDEAYERLEQSMAGPYVELFARQRRPGWDVAFSREADSGPGRRRWASNSYPMLPESPAPLLDQH
jgi:N6-adenosine-specific RNA methylase IME4